MGYMGKIVEKIVDDPMDYSTPLQRSSRCGREYNYFKVEGSIRVKYMRNCERPQGHSGKCKGYGTPFVVSGR